ncbi:hypothetical protein E5F26_14265, partial [Clostridioides difficile]
VLLFLSAHRILEICFILFSLFVCLCILKNLYLCGLPVPKRLKEKIGSLLDTMTDELNVKGGK